MNAFLIKIPQSSRERVMKHLKKLPKTTVESGGYADGSTAWYVYVDTELTQEQVEDHLGDVLGWYEIGPAPEEE